ncbi:MAG: hypothetical protein LBR25_02415, partial [Erysipelotrichaceae bacterium]|nr:hypothetical protein [Erysipelotrichaceae bacterium]
MKKKIDTKKRVEGIPATGEEIIENRESGFIAQESQVTKEFSSDESLKTDSLALSVCAKRKKPKDYRRVLTIAAIVLALVSGIFGIKFYFDYQAEQKALRLAELRATEEEKLAITLPKEFPSIEALSTYNTEELIQSYYGIKLTSDPKVLDTSTLGEKTIVYTITSEKYPD